MFYGVGPTIIFPRQVSITNKTMEKKYPFTLRTRSPFPFLLFSSKTNKCDMYTSHCHMFCVCNMKINSCISEGRIMKIACVFYLLQILNPVLCIVLETVEIGVEIISICLKYKQRMAFREWHLENVHLSDLSDFLFNYTYACWKKRFNTLYKKGAGLQLQHICS